MTAPARLFAALSTAELDELSRVTDDARRAVADTYGTGEPGRAVMPDIHALGDDTAAEWTARARMAKQDRGR